MRNMWRTAKHLYGRIIEVDMFGLAAQLAYFFLLSLFPFLLFLLNLIGYFPLEADIIIDTIGDFAPPEVMLFISSNLQTLMNSNNGGLLSIGIIGTLWAASNGVNAITRAFNKAYGIQNKRSFLSSRLIAVMLTIAMVGVIIVALLFPVFGRMIGHYLFSFFNMSAGFLEIWDTVRWVISSIIFFGVLLFLYKLGPHKRIYFKDVFLGALFATVCWQLVSWGFSYYVSNIGNYSAAYGSLGTVIVLMIWFYLFGIIVIAGGVINAWREDKIVTVKKLK